MFFCGKCGSTYEISNDVKYVLQQHGGKNDKRPKINIKNIIDKILNTEENKDKESIFEPEDGIEYLEEADIINHHEFAKLEADEAIMVLNKLNIYLPKSKKKVYTKSNTGLLKENKAYFVCTNCSNFELIKPGTVIFSQSNSENTDNFDMTLCGNNIYDMTLPRDRNYTCPNNDCVSHKDIAKKEQVTKRYRNNQKLIHTCCACKIVWGT